MKKLIVSLLAMVIPVVVLAQTALILLMAVAVAVSGGLYIYVLDRNSQIAGMKWVVLEVRRGHDWHSVLTNRVPVSQNPSFPAFFIAVDTNRNVPELCRVRLLEEVQEGNFIAPKVPDNYPYRPVLYNDDGSLKSLPR